MAAGREVKRRVASKALTMMKQRIRVITKRSGGRSLTTIVAELSSYLRGWKQYFRLADTPGVFRNLDEWIRHRLRAMQLKQWKRGRTAYRKLRALGIERSVAIGVARYCRSWWAMAAQMLNMAMPASYFDAIGLHRLAA